MGETGRRGRGCPGVTASALGREQKVEEWPGAARSPLCPTMYRQNAEQTLSPPTP